MKYIKLSQKVSGYCYWGGDWPCKVQCLSVCQVDCTNVCIGNHK